MDENGSNPWYIKDHDVEQENETSADTESEWSLPDPVERSDDELDGKVDLKDYQKYREKHHKSDSDSSEDSNMGP